MYLTYTEYTGMGGGAPESAFARLEAKARAYITAATFGRIAGEDPVRESVKFCTFDLIEAMNAADHAAAIAAGREIASMSNDGMSVSCATSGGSARTTSAGYAAVVRSWLSTETTADGTPLLYAGVSVV